MPISLKHSMLKFLTLTYSHGFCLWLFPGNNYTFLVKTTMKTSIFASVPLHLFQLVYMMLSCWTDFLWLTHLPGIAQGATLCPVFSP